MRVGLSVGLNEGFDDGIEVGLFVGSDVGQFVCFLVGGDAGLWDGRERGGPTAATVTYLGYMVTPHMLTPWR